MIEISEKIDQLLNSSYSLGLSISDGKYVLNITHQPSKDSLKVEGSELDHVISAAFGMMEERDRLLSKYRLPVETSMLNPNKKN